jgi:hypothetical protein
MREVDLQGISTLMQHPVTGQGLVYPTPITISKATFIFAIPPVSQRLLPHHPHNPTTLPPIQLPKDKETRSKSIDSIESVSVA